VCAFLLVPVRGKKSVNSHIILEIWNTPLLTEGSLPCAIDLIVFSRWLLHQVQCHLQTGWQNSCFPLQTTHRHYQVSNNVTANTCFQVHLVCCYLCCNYLVMKSINGPNSVNKWIQFCVNLWSMKIVELLIYTGSLTSDGVYVKWLMWWIWRYSFVTNFHHVLDILKSCYMVKYISVATITHAHKLLSPICKSLGLAEISLSCLRHCKFQLPIACIFSSIAI
jgi:hypothetical protein